MAAAAAAKEANRRGREDGNVDRREIPTAATPTGGGERTTHDANTIAAMEMAFAVAAVAAAGGGRGDIDDRHRRRRRTTRRRAVEVAKATMTTRTTEECVGS
jgi:hypothetical protein